LPQLENIFTTPVGGPNRDMIFDTYIGSEIAKIIEPLAHLRMLVFREYPYLYDGDFDFEKRYLQTYVKSRRSFVVLVRSTEGTVIGASTCLPLADEESALQGNFRQNKYDVDEIFYFGESVILPTFRGKGLGKTFFEYREQHAKSFGNYRYAAFCAVVRPSDHLLKPEGLKSPEALWQRLGYQKLGGVTARYSWKDIDQRAETEKTMQFWLKEFLDHE
jgi:GNAT superfamily N-acetyltransferase